LLSVKGYASDEMEQNYSRAKDLSQEMSDSLHQFRAIRGLWIFHFVRGRLTDARHLAEKLLFLANREQSSDLRVEAHRNLGTTYFYLDRFDEARTHLLTAKALYDPNQHHSHALLYGQNPEITARIYLARTLGVLGEIEQAETLALEAIGMARELDHPFTLAFALVVLSWVYATFRNANRTLELTDEAIAVSTQYSFKLVLARATAVQGWALAENGQEEGVGKLISGLSAVRATGESATPTDMLSLLAEIYLRKKRFSEGLAAIEDAQKMAVAHGGLFGKRNCFD
jgi:predicted ATPase